MNVIVYADESGTHDETGKKDGSNVAALAGFAASTKEWERFSADWQRVLNSYEADYFHFYEFAEASAVARGKRKPSSGFKDNPYRDWPLKKLDKFLFSLAKIAGSGNKIPIAGTINVKKYNEWLAEQKRLAQPTDDGYPYKYCVSEFFRVFFYEIALQWPTNRDPVTFVFDQKADKDWVSAITQCFANAKKYDARLKDFSFGDKKDVEHLPLQAADMISYVVRQSTENYLKDGLDANIPKLHRLLFRNLEKSIIQQISRQYPYLDLAEFKKHVQKCYSVAKRQ